LGKPLAYQDGYSQFRLNALRATAGRGQVVAKAGDFRKIIRAQSCKKRLVEEKMPLMKVRPVLGLLLATTIPSSWAACPTCTGEPAEDAPHFDLQHYVTDGWFGLRETLYHYGIEITGGYTTEPAGNPVGGLEHGFTYLHNFGFGVLFDLQKIAGISDTTFLITVSQRSGRGLTQDSIGNAVSVQQIFGGGQTYRLVQMRIDQKLFDDRLELSYGRLTTTADFLTSPFYCQFVNNGICGQPPAPFFNMPNGITAYPAAYWAGFARVQTTKNTYAKFGLYDGDVASGDDEHGANFGFGDNGVLVFTELGYQTKDGLWKMPSRYSFGGYVHTGDFPDVAEDRFGGNIFISGRHGREHSGQEGFYFLFEQMFLRNADRPETGLNGFVTFVVSPDEDKSAIPYFLNGGLIYEGLIPFRPNDKTALGFYSAWFSDRKRDAQQTARVPSQTNETDIELNHQIQITPCFYLRPNIQYVIKPNGLNQINNALVLGAETGITF
jgi:porin